MASSPQHEPTMEEILASIRKIISEDAPEAAPPAETVAAAPAPKLVEDPDDDIMELTEEAPAPVAAAPVAPPAPEPPKPAPEVVYQSIEEPVVTPAPSSEIFSDKTRKAIDDAFSNINVPDEAPKAAAPAVSATVAKSVDGNSVEAVFERAVRDAVGPHIDQWLDGEKDALLMAMRPLIREWMDDHFPALLEGAVRDEVARVVKARGR